MPHKVEARELYVIRSALKQNIFRELLLLFIAHGWVQPLDGMPDPTNTTVLLFAQNEENKCNEKVVC